MFTVHQINVIYGLIRKDVFPYQWGRGALTLDQCCTDRPGAQTDAHLWAAWEGVSLPVFLVAAVPYLVRSVRPPP